MMTIQQLTERYLDHHRALGHSLNTVRHYEDSIRIFYDFLASNGQANGLGVLTTATFQEFAKHLRATPTRGWRGSTTRSAHSVHGALKDWRAICRWAENEKLLDELPKVPVPRLPKHLFPVLSEEELTAIFASRQLDPRTEIGKRNRALIAFLLDTGVRRAELANLALADLDLNQMQAKVRGKGDRERMVFFSEGVRDNLRKWLSIRGDDAGTLFWLKPAGIRMLLKRIKQETGLDVLHCHQLRHTAATMMVRQHADLHSLKRILGHQQLSTVEAYLSLDTRDLRAKHAASSPFERIRPAVESEPMPARRRLKSS